MSRLIEFFEDDNSRLSMTRLTMFMSFFPASYIVILNQNDNALSWYLGAYVLGYIGGKSADAYRVRGQSKFREGDLKWQRS